MEILSGYGKLSVTERCPYREVRLYLYPPLSIVLYEPSLANDQVSRITMLSSVEGGMASLLERYPIHVTMSSGPTLSEPNLYLFTALVNSKLVWDS